MASIEGDSVFDTVERPEHYCGDGGIEPIRYILSHRMGYCEGNVVKYITRWKQKGGIEDLEKARKYLDFLIGEARLRGAPCGTESTGGCSGHRFP
jgi:hypothetical protein